MHKKVPFSNQHQKPSQIALHYTDLKESIKVYFENGPLMSLDRFKGYLPNDINIEKEKDERLAELNITSSFSVLAAIEAAFCIDYLNRCYKKRKDTLSRTFLEHYKKFDAKGKRLSFEDIIDLWQQFPDIDKKTLGKLKGAFKFRHWIAHGRYWVPKLERKYDYIELNDLAESVFGDMLEMDY
jgi:hypothetical protein